MWVIQAIDRDGIPGRMYWEGTHHGSWTSKPVFAAAWSDRRAALAAAVYLQQKCREAWGPGYRCPIEEVFVAMPAADPRQYIPYPGDAA